ncbi:MAG: glycosyltransferase [Bacteroidales bacterium]|nr:glycosyltransferase [Bacteroidales bacterium]
MVTNRDIVIFGLQRWDKFTSTITRNIAMEMSKNNRVLFVNPPLSRRYAIFRKDLPFVQKRLKILKGKEEDLVQENKYLWVFYPKMIAESINWIKPVSIFSFFHKKNEKRYANKIKDAIKRLNFKNIILFGDTEMVHGFYLKDHLKPDIFFYLLRDAITFVDYHIKHGKRLHPLLLKKADFVVTNSDTFERFAKKSNPRSYFIGQGCDIELYNDNKGKLKIPDDIKNIKKPIIGYIGALTTIRLDIDILIYIAEERPNWSLVLIGPQQEGFKNSRLDELKNVHFLGAKKPETLPSYLKGIDVTLNPQILNEITDLNYPLKLDEYLAMGKPVVATKTSFMKFYFKDYSYLADTKEEYVQQIEKALNEDSPEMATKRIAFAGEHSWEAFVSKMYEQIEKS